ncbi:MAG: PilZ domain-containing protein [Proteobacteria bacterium]|nr:PilZ domain-containing protein [Pseudomonadota bacterium]NDC23589.1 PilZ domain-containing protein [Pseudomonadota bacterium]NDD03681.1 PilZ domain-containing protein [Pseudomonadota bacterium]NDG25776.1 PilZ domain-containing protein [Pseudomonadota bacterium]
MRRRPLVLFIASLVFLFFPLSLIWDFLQGDPVLVSDWLIGGILPVVLIIGLIRVTKVAWYTLFGFIFFWGIRDYQTVEDATPVSIISHILIYVISLAYFIHPRIRRLYFDPKLRWWRTKQRYETHGPIIFKQGTKYYYPTLRNISEGGCFIETPHTQELENIIDIIIPLPVPLGLAAIETRGEVRWVSEKSERFGMGIQFLNLGPEQSAVLKKFVAYQI